MRFLDNDKNINGCITILCREIKVIDINGVESFFPLSYLYYLRLSSSSASNKLSGKIKVLRIEKFERELPNVKYYGDRIDIQQLSEAGNLYNVCNEPRHSLSTTT